MRYTYACSVYLATRADALPPAPPRQSLLTKIITAVSFPLAAFLSPPVMGFCYAYDAFGIFLGQRNYNIGGASWTNLLLVTAGTTTAAFVAKVGMNW